MDEFLISNDEELYLDHDPFYLLDCKFGGQI